MNDVIWREMVEEATRHQIRLVYLHVAQDDTISNAFLQTNGVLLVDEKVVYHMRFNANVLPPPGNIQLPSDQDIQALQSLAFQSGAFSRFQTDPLFEPEMFKKLYLTWLEKSLTGQMADQVLLYREGTQVVGFITAVIKEDMGEIGLIAVDHGSRGKSIGSQLIQGALHFFSTRHIQQVSVTTQLKNTGACRFYEKEGFQRKHITHIYHFWNYTP